MLCQQPLPLLINGLSPYNPLETLAGATIFGSTVAGSLVANMKASSALANRARAKSDKKLDGIVEKIILLDTRNPEARTEDILSFKVSPLTGFANQKTLTALYDLFDSSPIDRPEVYAAFGKTIHDLAKLSKEYTNIPNTYEGIPLTDTAHNNQGRIELYIEKHNQKAKSDILSLKNSEEV